jgi:hypothetical protein
MPLREEFSKLQGLAKFPFSAPEAAYDVTTSVVLVSFGQQNSPIGPARRTGECVWPTFSMQPGRSSMENRVCGICRSAQGRSTRFENCHCPCSVTMTSQASSMAEAKGPQEPVSSKCYATLFGFLSPAAMEGSDAGRKFKPPAGFQAPLSLSPNGLSSPRYPSTL